MSIYSRSKTSFSAISQKTFITQYLMHLTMWRSCHNILLYSDAEKVLAHSRQAVLSKHFPYHFPRANMKPEVSYLDHFVPKYALFQANDS
jgi:hypothetical protein